MTTIEKKTLKIGLNRKKWSLNICSEAWEQMIDIELLKLIAESIDGLYGLYGLYAYHTVESHFYVESQAKIILLRQD